MTRTASSTIDWRTALVALALAGMFSHVAASGETPAAYRRILVPADSPSTWPRNGETYLPVEAHDFDAWVAAANQPTSAANIATAEYQARLAGNELTGGRGWWRVVLHGEPPARILLGETSLVIRNAKWRGRSGEPARLGWSSRGADESPAYALEVPRSGELEFDWHATPIESTTGALEIPLRLPIAASARLLVEFPADKRPVLEGSVVLESPAKSAAGGRWVLAVGTSPTAVLRIEDANRVETKSAFSTSVREDLRYEVGKRGIQLEAKLRLSTRGAPLKELSVSLPTGLQLIAAAVGEHDLKWRVAEDEADGAIQAVIEPPAAPPDGSMTVVLRAWGPLVTGETQQLPKLTVRDAFWTSGTIELALDPSLELRDLSPIDCVQITAEAGPTARDQGQLRRFAAFSPSAAVELALDHRPASGHVRMGTALEVGNPGVAGRLVAEVCVDRGSLHKLSAELQPGWSIDAVETMPADALGEWYVDRASGRDTIELQLHRAVTPQQRVTIIVTGRLQRSAAIEPLPLDALVLLKWSDLAIESNLLQIKAAEQFELEPVGEWQSVAADGLSADERHLFTVPTEGQFCDLENVAAGAAIRLTSKKGAYDAAIQLEAALAQGQLRQTYRVDCRPRGSGIDHVLVYLSEPTAEPLRWIDARSREPLVAERMPARDPRLGGLPPGGELWLLHLRRLYARPIAITATQFTPWPQRRRIPLVSLPDAESQQGRVSVSSGGAELPTIVAQDMVPTPLPMKLQDDSPPEHSAETRAIYRFQPTRFYDVGRAPELWLGSAAAESGDNRLLATEVDVESHFAADGSGIHHVTYQLENHGATKVELTLPQGVRLESARVDGQPVPSTALETIAIQLSARTLSTVLELDLASQHPPLGNGCRIRAPLPSGPITVLHGNWTILLPHDFAAVGAALTPADEAFEWRQRLFGPLARPQSERRFNPFAARDWNALWADVSRSMTTPAQAAEDPAPGNSPMPTGWHAFQVGFVAAPPDAITIAHPPATTAWALAIFLGCAFGASLCRLRTLHAVLLAAVAAALSLLLPIVYAPLATAAVLGLLTAALWQWVKHSIGINRPALAIVAAAVLMASAPAHAAPQTEAVQRVLVPVDSNGQSTGTKYFVGEDFLRRLMRSSAEPSGGDWLLTDMRCDGELVPGADSTELRSGKWNVTFEIDVLARDATVELPLVQREAEWPAAASLDGMPAPIAWATTGRGCSIQVAEPGHYRLTIPFAPRVEEAAGRRQVTLSLPPVMGATVRISSPAGLADLRSGGPILARRDESGRSVWHGKLDASGQFTASWTDQFAATSANGNRRVDELLWLHVEPEGVELDAKYLLPSGADWPDTIDVAVADDWELLSGNVATSTDHAEVSPDDRQLLHVRVPQAAAGNRQVTLRFRARESSPLGRLRVPEIRLTSLPVENRWLAISGAKELECVPSASPLAAAGPLSEFVAAWGADDEAAPQFVWNAAKLDANWYVAVRPRMELSTCRDRLSLAAGRDGLRVNYRSDVTPKGANCFAWSLEVPAELAVQDIAITSTGKPIAFDWVRAAPNRINVFFAETVSKQYRLQLNGRLPMADVGRLPLPRIRPAGQPQPTQTVALYRDEEVLAEWHFPGDAPWVESGASQSPPFGPESHFVRAYSVDPLTADAVRIRVEPNEPSVSGETLTTIAQANRVWTATYACELRVERGELDVLRLRVPPTFAGPFTITPTATTELAPSGDTPQATMLSIRLPQPARVGDAVKFEVRSPLALSDGELPTAPQIVPLVPGARQDYLALPTSLDGERAVWTHTGIEPAELPPDLRPDSSDPGSAETFRVVADAMNVALRPRPARASSANVRLAETTVHLGPAGGKFAVTRFIVAAEGLDQCVVELPAGERLVRATLDGHPALARSLEPRRWQVQLGPPNLPQTLEIVSRSVDRSEASSRLVEMSRPVLEQAGQPIPVDLSLWTLCRSATGGTPRVTGGAVVTPAELAAMRLDRLASISQSATRSVIESPVVDGFNWFAHWAAEIQAAERAAKSLPLPSTGAAATIRVPQPSDNLLSDNIARCDAWVEQVAEIFAAAEMTLSGPEPAAPATFDLWQGAASGPGDRVCFISDGGQDRLYVELVPDGLSAAATRFAALASIAALTLAAIWLVRTPPALELVKDWPETVGVVLGLAAWAWLRPSLAGLVVVAVSLSFVVRHLYLERKAPRHDSSKQSNSIQEELA